MRLDRSLGAWVNLWAEPIHRGVALAGRVRPRTPPPASFLPPPQKERERDGGRESGVLWKGAEGEESKKEKGTETWRSVVGAVSQRSGVPRRRTSRSARGPRALRSAVALAAGCAPGDPAARRRRRRGATGVPVLPAEGAQAA